MRILWEACGIIFDFSKCSILRIPVPVSEVYLGNILLWSMFTSVVVSTFLHARDDFMRTQAVPPGPPQPSDHVDITEGGRSRAWGTIGLRQSVEAY